MPKSEARIAGQRTEAKAETAKVAEAKPATAKPAPAQSAQVKTEQPAPQPMAGPAKGGSGEAIQAKGGAPEAQRSAQAAAEKSAEPAPAAPAKKGLLGSYKDEVAELLGGAKARRRRNVTASGLPAPEPDDQEPPIKLTRPPRRGRAHGKD
jgi:hypothetical protein